jgi:hypothetical protein
LVWSRILKHQPRILHWIGNATLVALVILVILRLLLPLHYSSQAFIQTGLFYDKICYLGSYVSTVCPYLAPPFETLAVILVIVFIGCKTIEAFETRSEHGVASGKRPLS